MRPVGVLLVEVQLPAAGLGFEAQQALLATGQRLQPALRLVVYCSLTGQLLRRRDWVRQEECILERHPRHRIMAWNSRCASRAPACSHTLRSCGIGSEHGHAAGAAWACILRGQLCYVSPATTAAICLQALLLVPVAQPAFDVSALVQ